VASDTAAWVGSHRDAEIRPKQPSASQSGAGRGGENGAIAIITIKNEARSMRTSAKEARNRRFYGSSLET